MKLIFPILPDSLPEKDLAEAFSPDVDDIRGMLFSGQTMQALELRGCDVDQCRFTNCRFIRCRLENFRFFRIHKSYLINLDQVREVFPWGNNSFALKMNGYEKNILPIGREKTKVLRQLLGW